MKFEKGVTVRGFDICYFNDDYSALCSLQQSSSVIPHIWLGIDNPEPKIMCKDAIKLGLPAQGSVGWQDYNIPKEVSITTRMHLTKKQARKLARKLLKFGLFGKI